MDKKVILILGGYGNTGRPLARLLLQESQVQLVLAGRNLEKARAYASELNDAFENNRVRAERVDASDMAQLKQAFSSADLVVVASSTTQFTHQVASAALEARIDYLDVQYSPHKIALLKSMAGEIEHSGCCFITDGGFHPGLPACLVRFIARYFDQLEIARVGSVIKQDWKSLEVDDSTVAELVDLVNDFEMSTFKDGKWQKINFMSTSGYIRMDFGERFGRQLCAPMMLEEMRLLPVLYPSLKDTGFYVGSFNWFTDWVIMPVSMVAMKLWPDTARGPLSRWMHWGLKTFSNPPYGMQLRVEARGKKGSQPTIVQLTLSHPDGYLFTAIPVAACLLQYLDGSLDKPGLWMQALVVEPIRFMQDMRRMGIEVHITGGGGNEMEQE